MEDEDDFKGINFDVIMRQKKPFWAVIPVLSGQPELLELTLEGYDLGGIWVRNQKLTDTVLAILKTNVLEGTPVFFVPYSAIHWATVTLEGVSLSAKGLGLEP